MNSLSVIIPSRDAGNLIACVETLRKYEPEVDVLVVDDGLDCTDLEYLDPITFIQGRKPFVYSRNCNIGILQTDDSDVILLGDDGLLETPGGLSALQAQHYANPDFGLISSSIDFCGTPNQHRLSADKLRLEAVMLMFACVFIPRSTIQKIGLLDERFCIGADGVGPRGYGCEDDDYSWRVRQAGMKLGVYDGCHVCHTKLRHTFRDDTEWPVDVRLHEALFEKKWGTSPRRPFEW